ncbi:MAG: F0F1 ATP synthase subunit B [Planctomycetota bacterium]
MSRYLSATTAFTALTIGLTLIPSVAFAAGGGEQAGLMDPNLVTFLASCAIFTVVLIALWKLAWGPLIKALDDRERKIRESLEAADRAAEESKKAAVEHERVLAEARKEATSIVEEGKRDATVVKDGIVADARAEAEAIRSRTLADIERAKNNAVYEIHDRAVELSYAIAEKVIAKSLNKDDHDSLVKETIQRYDRMEGAQL